MGTCAHAGGNGGVSGPYNPSQAGLLSGYTGHQSSPAADWYVHAHTQGVVLCCVVWCGVVWCGGGGVVWCSGMVGWGGVCARRI